MKCISRPVVFEDRIYRRVIKSDGSLDFRVFDPLQFPYTIVGGINPNGQVWECFILQEPLYNVIYHDNI